MASGSLVPRSGVIGFDIINTNFDPRKLLKKEGDYVDKLWLIFALLSAVSAALVAIFGKVGLKDVDPNTATAIRAIIMTVFLFGVVLVQGKLNQIPSIIANKKAMTFITLSGIAGALSWLFYFIALKFGKVSQVAPIDKLSVVIAAILAIVLLHEKISTLNGVGIGFIAIGAIIVALS